MSFFNYVNEVDWADLKISIYSKTETNVLEALSKERLDIEDFAALISPAAEPYLEEMADKSMSITRARFGNTVSFYAPLYLSNLCSNVCTYCGFSMENKLKRKVLSLGEIESELDVLKSMHFDNVLLVTGEHSTKVGMDYFRSVIPQIKKRISYLSIEVQPLELNDYKELVELGVDAVMIYQESYHPSVYSKHHLKGKKMDFRYRLETPERLAEARVDKIGLGALIGLEDWRTESFVVAKHLSYLESKYWRTKYSISFPRLRPCEGSLKPVSNMSDRQLVQLICAYRLFDNEVELSLSTRESPYFRDNVLPLGITNISAGSKTKPGGYSDATDELEQFAINDTRSVELVAQSVRDQGLTPVWSDWHATYSG